MIDKLPRKQLSRDTQNTCVHSPKQVIGPDAFFLRSSNLSRSKMPKKRVKKNKNALAANEPPKEAVKEPEELDLEEEEDGVEEGFTYHSEEEEAQEDADQEFSELSEEHTSQDKGTEFWNDTMHTAWTIVRSVAVALVCLLNKIRFPIISQPQVLVPSSHTHEIARLKSILPTANIIANEAPEISQRRLTSELMIKFTAMIDLRLGEDQAFAKLIRLNQHGWLFVKGALGSGINLRRNNLVDDCNEDDDPYSEDPLEPPVVKDQNAHFSEFENLRVPAIVPFSPEFMRLNKTDPQLQIQVFRFNREVAKEVIKSNLIPPPVRLAMELHSEMQKLLFRFCISSADFLITKNIPSGTTLKRDLQALLDEGGYPRTLFDQYGVSFPPSGSSGAYGGGGRGSRGAAARPVRSSQDERMPDGF